VNNLERAAPALPSEVVNGNGATPEIPADSDDQNTGAEKTATVFRFGVSVFLFEVDLDS
jgi:hypothetical protein